MVDVPAVGQKPMTEARGEKGFQMYQKGFRARVKVLKESWKAGRYVFLA